MPDIDHNAFPDLPETYEPAQRNPHYTRWDDPFFGLTRDYLAGLGDGDVTAGHDRVLRGYIASRNKVADAAAKDGRALPHVSFERGMEWIPVIGQGAEGEEENKRRKARFEKRKASGERNAA